MAWCLIKDRNYISFLAFTFGVSKHDKTVNIPVCIPSLLINRYLQNTLLAKLWKIKGASETLADHSGRAV
jgi:hypothetical protein